MSVPSQSLPSIGSPNSTEDSKVRSCLSELQTILTAGVDANNITSATNGYLGLSDSSIRRGKSIISTSESRSNTAYGTLTTPDQVSSIVLPTDGLIFVAFRAQWAESVSAAARAAIFLGATQVQYIHPTAGPTVQEAATGGSTAGRYGPLLSTQAGLNGTAPDHVGANTWPTTGTIVGVDEGTVGATTSRIRQGSVTIIEAAAGTYNISVQFKASSGSVTVQDRKLWVWTMGF